MAFVASPGLPQSRYPGSQTPELQKPQRGFAASRQTKQPFQGRGGHGLKIQGSGCAATLGCVPQALPAKNAPRPQRCRTTLEQARRGEALPTRYAWMDHYKLFWLPLLLSKADRLRQARLVAALGRFRANHDRRPHHTTNWAIASSAVPRPRFAWNTPPPRRHSANSRSCSERQPTPRAALSATKATQRASCSAVGAVESRMGTFR